MIIGKPDATDRLTAGGPVALPVFLYAAFYASVKQKP